MLAVLEALGAHFHEHHADLLRMPWLVFCGKWVRLIEYEARERVRKRRQAEERERDELRREHHKRIRGEG